MATDTKRGNLGGKVPVATPNLGPSAMLPPDAAMSGAIGARVRITTTPPTSQTLEGTLFTVCPITHLLALNTSTPSPNPNSNSSTQPSDYHILPVSRIQTFQILSPTPSETSSPATSSFSINNLDFPALRRREAAAVARIHDKESRRGKGVSKDAQDIFDALVRTMPARWEGTSIVVSDSVIIEKPYRVENCRAVAPGQGGGEAALGWVRKVLDMERKKIELRNASANINSNSRAAATDRAGSNAAGPRKGG